MMKMKGEMDGEPAREGERALVEDSEGWEEDSGGWEEDSGGWEEDGLAMVTQIRIRKSQSVSQPLRVMGKIWATKFWVKK
jgi:hypothetical protein